MERLLYTATAVLKLCKSRKFMFIVLFVYPEGLGSRFHRGVVKYLPDYTALEPERQYSTEERHIDVS
jgi:hypothetical protein